jgi:arginyl-tRNA synthetase
MLVEINKCLNDIFENFLYDKKYAYFQYSDRPDLSDFQTNCSMPLAKLLKKNPLEIANKIVEELKKINCISKVAVDGPGFINVSIKDEFLLKFSSFHFSFPNQKKIIVLDYSSVNVAKEMHVGHLRSTIIGESLKRIFRYAGDEVIGDNHLGDWGTNMGMVIEAIKTKYGKMTDLKLTAPELLELYRYSNNRSKDDKEYYEEVKKDTNKLQNKEKEYYELWKYFWEVSIDDMKEIYKMLDVEFELWNGESIYHDLCGEMIEELDKNGLAKMSEGAKIIDLNEFDLPPFILVKSDGSFLYSTTDLATCKYRKEKFDPDLELYVVDYRQSLHFKQLFESAKKCGYLTDKNKAEHISYGTMNGKDGKPFKTRSGDTMNLRDLIDETVAIIQKKSTVKDRETIERIAIACLKFADLLNFRESSYVFDLEQFTNYEGKTGAYILYSLVRINSILNGIEKKETKITTIKTAEERDLLLELTRFSEIFKMTYHKRAPHFLAEYTYNIAKKFNSFYTTSPINTEKDEEYKNTKISILYLTKEYLELCLHLLSIKSVVKM